ncbi:MAG: CRISPR system precrRNA processing endoribonuclease RAMP protein Cas6 [Acidobacteriota bacterium]
MIANETAGSGAGLPYVLPELRHARFRITLRALTPARLPPFHGSTLRGAFGHALRKTVCSFGPDAPCPTCVLRSECPYPRIFETPNPGQPLEPLSFLAGVTTAPRPYLFEPRSTTTTLAVGETLGFDLLLFGRAIELQRYALAAVERLAAGGLGAAVAGRKAEFAVAGVEPIPPSGAPLPNEPLPGDGHRVRLRFVTPVRLLDHKRVVPPDRPRALAFAMIRRLLELAHFHAPDSTIDWTFKPLLEHAGTLEVVGTDLRFHDVERYSQRQQTHTPLGGYEGTLDLRGDLEPLAPLLRAAEVIHVGKGTVFGLGQLAIEAA